MNEEEMRSILADHLGRFRAWDYDPLAKEIDRTKGEHDCLAHFEGTASDGSSYQIELNVFWDNQPNGDIRVIGDISVDPQKRLLGFLPIVTPNLTDDFIMTPDGSFVGEESETGTQNKPGVDNPD